MVGTLCNGAMRVCLEKWNVFQEELGFNLSLDLVGGGRLCCGCGDE